MKPFLYYPLFPSSRLHSSTEGAKYTLILSLCRKSWVIWGKRDAAFMSCNDERERFVNKRGKDKKKINI